MAEKLTLESPVVKEAKKVYEASKLYRSRKVPFEDLWAAYNKNLEHKVIEELTSLRKRTSWYTFKKYFESVSSRKPDAELWRARKKQKLRERLNNLELKLPASFDVRYVATAARRVKARVSVLPIKGDELWPATKLISINSRICSVQGTKATGPNAAIYISRKKTSEVDAFVLLFPPRGGTEERRLYLVPAKVMWQVHFGNTSEPYTTLTTPGMHCSGNTKLCLHGYRDAWWVVGQLK